MLPSEELSICFAPAAFSMHERFWTLDAGISSFVDEVRAKPGFFSGDTCSLAEERMIRTGIRNDSARFCMTW
jgi:hypothetical protein